MMKNNYIFLSILFLFSGLQSFGQTDSLSLDTVPGQNYNFFLGVTDTVTLSLTNNDSLNAFAGTIKLGYRAQGAGTTIFESNDSVQINQLQGSASMNVEFSGVTFSQPDFQLGGNGIVVWPITNNPPDTVDSLHITVVLGDNLAVIDHNWEGYHQLKLYPNPASEVVNWQFKGLPVLAEQVRVFDPRGKLIKLERNQNNLRIDELPAGVYFLQLQIKGNQRKTFRLIKS